MGGENQVFPLQLAVLPAGEKCERCGFAFPYVKSRTGFRILHPA